MVATTLIVVAGSTARGRSQSPASTRWITAWGTSQQTAANAALTNTTVRLNARVTIGGDAVRIRLDNAYGKSAVKIGRAYVGVRARGPVLVPGSNKPALFNGSETATIPAGGTVRSDPIVMNVLAMQDLAVSLYIPDADVRASQHTGALSTSYAATVNAGDHAAMEGGDPFTATLTTMPLLKAIDVSSRTAPGAIVAFGDSITDGTCSTLDAHDRWVDWLSVRLRLDSARRDAHKAVVNEGIGGNTLTSEGLQPPPDSSPGLERLERDVLSHAGVTDVILFMGTNDIRRGASAAQVIDAMTRIAAAIKARRMKSDWRHDHPAAQRAAVRHEHRLERRQDGDSPRGQPVDSHPGAVRRRARLRRRRARRVERRFDLRALQLRRHPPDAARLLRDGSIAAAERPDPLNVLTR